MEDLFFKGGKSLFLLCKYLLVQIGVKFKVYCNVENVTDITNELKNPVLL